MDDCPICLDPIQNTHIVQLKCKHQYHLDCFQKLLNYGYHNCSLCNQEIECSSFIQKVTQYIIFIMMDESISEIRHSLRVIIVYLFILLVVDISIFYKIIRWIQSTSNWILAMTIIFYFTVIANKLNLVKIQFIGKMTVPTISNLNFIFNIIYWFLKLINCIKNKLN
jgi:hypothetical protein